MGANRAELELGGYAEPEYVGHPVAQFLVEPQAVADMLVRLARHERVESVATRLRAKDGSIKQVLIDGNGLFRDGRFVHARLVTVAHRVEGLNQSFEGKILTGEAVHASFPDAGEELAEGRIARKIPLRAIPR